MSIDEALAKGDFTSALRQIEADPSSASNPAALFMIFEIKALLEDFPGSKAALEKTALLDPGLQGYVHAMRACLESSRICSLRRTSLETAANRTWLRKPPPSILRHAAAALAFAKGDLDEADSLLAEVKREAPKVGGVLTTSGDAIRFMDLWDSDDLTGPAFVGVAERGPIDLPFCELRSIRFLPPGGFQDLLWRCADFETIDGKALKTRVLGFYPGSGTHEAPEVRTGRLTVWTHHKGIAIGYGQRDLKATTSSGGTSLIGIQNVVSIEFGDQPEVKAPS